MMDDLSTPPRMPANMFCENTPDSWVWGWCAEMLPTAALLLQFFTPRGHLHVSSSSLFLGSSLWRFCPLEHQHSSWRFSSDSLAGRTSSSGTTQISNNVVSGPPVMTGRINCVDMSTTHAHTVQHCSVVCKWNSYPVCFSTDHRGWSLDLRIISRFTVAVACVFISFCGNHGRTLPEIAQKECAPGLPGKSLYSRVRSGAVMTGSPGTLCPVHRCHYEFKAGAAELVFW